MSDTQGSRVGSMFGPYELKRLLGRGGMGEVYEAEHTIKEWTVAVKVMTAEFSKDPVFRERMKREARIAGRLQEPHVVPIHDYGEIDGQMYLEMRLIEGIDLDNVLKRFGPLTPPRAVAIITQIASALDAAHAAGVMHRDVKPPNILVTRDDFAYLVDFGIASATTDEKLTQMGTAVGTWKYMAPERFSNDEVTYRADIYSLACVLYECLTGGPPYRADSAGSLVTAHLMNPVPQVSTARAGIPKSFDAVIARGMAKKPEDRYASAGDLALAAHEALSSPDQDHAENILRRSQEATLPGPPTASSPPTMPASVAPPQRPSPPSTPPPRPPAPPYGGGSGPSGPAGPPPQQQRPAAPSGHPAWTPVSGPMPASGPQNTPQYHQSGGWGGGPPNTPLSSGPIPSGWNQGNRPPPAKRNPWPIVAAVAVVLVLVVGGVVIWLATRPGPGTKLKPIAEDRLSSLLLSTSEVNAVMGSSRMQPGKPITTMDSSPATLSIPDCLGAMYGSQGPAYAGSGYTGISGLVSSEPGDSHDHWVNQAAIAFPTADKAKAFLQTSLTKWKGCAGKTVTVTNSGETYRWTFSSVQGTSPRITVTDAQEGANGWECQRAMEVANNVIVDVNACGFQITDQGGQIADKIIAKVNKEK
ncbi:serine/threonine-protein kinase PknH/PknJ [Mycobacterium gordonae]|uniref:non-specific serine/threonine protein kinase n=1 Tax=Mycobacterium gordonae TaxID=1778 RepID=A0A1X1X9C5_MYCGO|nr:serine/threonine-protein kinase PknH/PknJ [Mycobacterium gordonae]MCQ4365724.1 serine/threonine-protein kinase PknH/PknJ [Mycobacterium gordonae]ORV95432.1 serine/threonine protein kinase [Mycobacterium gordonae]